MSNVAVSNVAVSTSRFRRCVAPAAVAVAAGALLAVVGTVDPGIPGRYPTCPFLSVTGLFCPGCGTLRALHAMAHLDVQAVSLNALTVAAAPVLACIWWQWARRNWAGAPRPGLAPAWRIRALLAVVLAFWVLRNLGATAFLAP